MANEVYLYRGCAAVNGAKRNPLTIKNFERADPLSGVHFAVANDHYSLDDAISCAEDFALLHADMLHRKPLVVKATVKDNSFPLLVGRLTRSQYVFGKLREIPINTFEELKELRLGSGTVIVNAEDLTTEQLQSLDVVLGKVGPEGNFVYESFMPLEAKIEGSHISNEKK